MRKELNNMIEKIEDPVYKKVRLRLSSSLATVLEV